MFLVKEEFFNFAATLIDLNVEIQVDGSGDRDRKVASKTVFKHSLNWRLFSIRPNGKRQRVMVSK